MPPLPLYLTCQDCKRWTRDPDSYAWGHCSLPAKPAMKPEWPQLLQWPRTLEGEVCSQLEPRGDDARP